MSTTDNDSNGLPEGDRLQINVLDADGRVLAQTSVDVAPQGDQQEADPELFPYLRVPSRSGDGERIEVLL